MIRSKPSTSVYRDNYDRVFRPTDEPKYPCQRCGVLRTKAEGGTVFTVCDDCWDIPTKGAPQS